MSKFDKLVPEGNRYKDEDGLTQGHYNTFRTDGKKNPTTSDLHPFFTKWAGITLGEDNSNNDKKSPP